MKKAIKVKVTEGFIEYSSDGKMGCDVNEGDVIYASLYEPTQEYFGKDLHGREVFVGEINDDGNLELSDGFELVI